MTTRLDPDTFRYQLHVTDQSGRRLFVPTSSLVWTENADNLAAEVRCTVPGLPFEIGGETFEPWDTYGCGTPVFLSVVPKGGTSTARADVAASSLLGRAWDPGDVASSAGGVEVFQGTVLELRASTSNPLALELMARDPLHYLLLSDLDFAIPEGTTFRAALEQFAATWGLDVGRIDGPDIELGEYSTGNEIKTAGDVLAELLDQANAAGAGLFLMRATGGKLEIIAPGTNEPVYELRSRANAGSSTVSVSITDLVEEVEVFAEDQAPPAEPGEEVEDPEAPITGRKGTSGKVLPLRRMAGASSHAGFSGARKRVKVSGISYSRSQGSIDLFGSSGGGGVSSAAGSGARTGSQVNEAERYAIAVAGGFSQQEAITMAAISLLECASCDFSSVNASGDIGLFQINSQHWGRYGGQMAMIDPVNNARAAYGIYSGSGGGERGWRNWCVYPGGCNGASPTTRAQFDQLEARIRQAIGWGGGIGEWQARQGMVEQVGSSLGGNYSSSGPSQERADLEALSALADDGFPKWRWQHTTLDLPHIRKYDMLSIRDRLIDGRMIVAGVAHQPSQGSMSLDLLDEETFERRSKLQALNRQLAKLRGEEDLLRKEMQRAGTSGGTLGGSFGGQGVSTPTVLQEQNWSCSAASATWVLRALGKQTTEQDVINKLQAVGGISSAVGLHDASMGQLSNVVYSAFGVSTSREVGVSWDRLVEIARSGVPAQINGMAWNHHSGLRGFDGQNLTLANPAPNWMGTGQSLSRADFNRLGPWNVLYPTGGTSELLSRVGAWA